jgi:hypothetical protein
MANPNLALELLNRFARIPQINRMANLNIFLGLLILFGVGVLVLIQLDDARRKHRSDTHK